MGYEIKSLQKILYLNEASFLARSTSSHYMSSRDKNSRSQQLPQKPDRSAVLPFLWRLPQQQRQLVAVRGLFGFHQLAIFSKHLILLMGTDSKTTHNLELAQQDSSKPISGLSLMKDVIFSRQ